ncbi:MAG: hypothetical protein J0H34_05585 [Rhizobiales bacterium]|nr:hypothetical protein [Hyphomicrobiales bacterium]
MRLLTEMAGESLVRGDILRLADNYDLGRGSGPVDLMVYDPHGEDGLGLMVVSGYKAGLTFCIFPIESSNPGTRSLDAGWLLRNWEHWFVYTYLHDAHGRLMPLPVEGAQVLGWTEREITVRTDAHSRPPRP